MARAITALRRLTALLVPGAVLLLAAWAVQTEEVVRTAAAPYALFFCWGTLTAAVLLSWYYDQSRLLCLASVVALSVWLLARLPDPDAARLAAITLLPLNFILFASVKERGVMTFEGFLKVGVVLAQVFGVAWVQGATWPGVEAILRWGQRSDAGAWLPLTAMLAFAIAGLTLLALVVVRRSKLEAGLLWALVAMFLAVHAVGQPEVHLIYAGAAGLVLVFAVLEHGYDIAYRDELTGLPGRRAFNRIMEQLSGTYALAMCDVDWFKRLNDAYGHEAGDQILKVVAAKLSQVGGGGRAFRYGGEEFLIIFRGLSARRAQPFAESLRNDIAGAGFVVRGSDRPPKKPARPPEGNRTPEDRIEITITISIGIAGRSKRHSSPELVLDAADAALYRAKEAGRNCVKLAESTPD
jgi:GGDEF domain-containing protein